MEEAGTHMAEERKVDGELGAGEKGTGEVIRGIGEETSGEKGKAGY